MKKHILGISMLAAMGIAGNANALIIDDFDGGVQSVTVPAGDSTVAYAGALGGSRTIGITSPGPLSASADVIAGIFAHSSGAQTPAISTITWGGGLGGIDFVEGLTNNTFSFDILGIDQGNIDLILSVEDTFGGSDSFTFSGAAIGTQTVAFSNFAGVDFTSVDFLSLTVDGGPASDLTLDLLATSGDTPPPVTVPEPGALMLFGVGLLGMLGLRRRKTKNS